MSDSDSPDLPGPALYSRTRFEAADTLAYRRKIPEAERLITWQRNNVIKHAGVSLAEARDVHLWANNQIMCFYDAYEGVYDSLTMEHTPIDWSVAVGTPVVDVPGTTVAFPHLDPHNYYHWLIDTMPCFGILERAGVDIKEVQHLYVHRMAHAFQWNMLALMGVDVDQVIYQRAGNENAHYRFERLLVPDFRLDGSGWPHPWGARYLSKKFAGPKVNASRYTEVEGSATKQQGPGQSVNANGSSSDKLYIARGGARRTIINESALIDALIKRDYRIMHPHELTFMQQVAAMRQVKFVLSSHGAGLANIVFCPPGLRMMEFCGHYITTHFRMLAEYCGAQYRAIAAGIDGHGNRLPVSFEAEVRNLDFTVDIDEIVVSAENFYQQSKLAQVA